MTNSTDTVFSFLIDGTILMDGDASRYAICVEDGDEYNRFDIVATTPGEAYAMAMAKLMFEIEDGFDFGEQGKVTIDNTTYDDGNYPAWDVVAHYEHAMVEAKIAMIDQEG